MRHPDKVALTIPNVPKQLADKAKRLADEQDRPLAQVMRELLREWIAEQEQKLPTR